MADTFESLELAPWIVRQTSKLGKIRIIIERIVVKRMFYLYVILPH